MTRQNLTFRRPARALALATGLSLACASGCTSMKVTGTSRSGTEQLLLTGAWDSALCTVDFRPLAGSRAFLNPDHVTVVDKDWVLSSIRRTMAEQGVLLENNKDKAQVIVEPAFGAYGTDERNTQAGLPQLGITPSLTGLALSSSGPGSSVQFSQKTQQDAVVKAWIFAYEVKTGKLVWESGPLLKAQGVRDHFFFGSGPYRLSSLPEVEQYPAEAQSRTRKRLFKRWFGE